MVDLNAIELPTLSDGRLTVRPWRAGDAGALAAMCNDEEAARWLPLPAPFTLADAQEWIADAPGKWRRETFAAFAVDEGPMAELVGSTAELVGSVSVRVDTHRQLADIGYLTRREVRGRGVAAATVMLLADWCFDGLWLGRVQIRCDPANVASRRVAERCGFQFEGILRAENLVRDRRADSAIFSLLPSDRRAT